MVILPQRVGRLPTAGPNVVAVGIVPQQVIGIMNAPEVVAVDVCHYLAGKKRARQ